MAWQGIEAHDAVAAKLRHALARGKLASTFLFVGPEGIGKYRFALKFAQALLCERHDEKQLEPCGRCPACVQVQAGTHPDLILVSRPDGKSDIPVGAIKGDPEKGFPLEDCLLYRIALKPFYGRRKVAILNDADDLNIAGGNALLKTLEEPPPGSVLILVGTSPEKQLSTIRSRAQLLRFNPLPEDVVARLLVEHKIAPNETQAKRLAAFSGGSVSRAAELADEALWNFRGELLAALSKRPLASITLAQTVSKFVEEAGKEASARRARLRTVLSFAVDFFRHVLRGSAGLSGERDEELSRTVQRALQASTWNVESAGDAAQRTLEAIAHIDRNANQSTLIESWLDDLLTLSRGKSLPVSVMPV